MEVNEAGSRIVQMICVKMGFKQLGEKDEWRTMKVVVIKT